MLLTFGGSTGVWQAVGAPDWRVFAGFSWMGLPEGDPDNDGILGDADACPLRPEDLDQWEDDDGCPDEDNDQDGVPDVDDACPLTPEDVDGFEEKDGCPDDDNDRDGIPDGADRCPNEPEDKDGFEDADGCVDRDNDRDGIPDVDDACPNVPEDGDDRDGCPAGGDADGDGIADAADQCPNQPETFNAINDTDGCPDEGGRVKLSCDKIEITEKVYFEHDSAVIRRVSYGLLDDVASVLTAGKNILQLVRVEGHTDNQGPEEYNDDLSLRRAKAVAQYLIRKGVRASMLQVAGLGERLPIADNKTRRGRATNRRVMFVVVERRPCPKALPAPR
jgi:outer membrane protein OmpA-like peptidoglycan-associated protein